MTRTRKTLLAAVPLLAIGAGAALLACGTGSAAESWSVEVIAGDLDYPWDIVAAGETILMTEKAGTVVTIADGELRRAPLVTEDAIRTEGGAGLLGLALAPDFAETGRAYFYHSYADAGAPANKVIEAQFDGTRWMQTAVLVDAIPGHRLYNGGRIAIGPDGHLYVTTGWTENYERPQDLESLAGKTLRMELDGAVPDGNPFPGSLVYSYGHRNPQGLAWDAGGAFYVSEHGQSALDEINRVEAGANYGWPVISGTQTRPGMEAPLVSSGRTTWAPSGLAHDGERLLMASLRQRGLYAYDIEPDGEAGALDLVYRGEDRIRQVLPVDGALYVITTNRSPRRAGPSQDRLLRLSPQP